MSEAHAERQATLTQRELDAVHEAYESLSQHHPAHEPLRRLLERERRIERRPTADPDALVVWSALHGGVRALHVVDPAVAFSRLLEAAYNVAEYESMLRLEEGREDVPHREHARAALAAWCEKLRQRFGPLEWTPTGPQWGATQLAFPEEVFEQDGVLAAVVGGPEDFRGSDEESHYAAPAKMREAREALERARERPVLKREVDLLMQGHPEWGNPATGENVELLETEGGGQRVKFRYEGSGMIASLGRDAFLRKFSALFRKADDAVPADDVEKEPGPEPLSLGMLEGALSEEEAALARIITRLTGYMPHIVVEVREGVKNAIVKYRYRVRMDPKPDEKGPPLYDWRIREVTAEGKPDVVLIALRDAVRMVRHEHVSDIL